MVVGLELYVITGLRRNLPPFSFSRGRRVDIIWISQSESQKKRADVKVYIVNANSVTPILLEVDQTPQLSVSEKEERDILTLPKLWAKTTTKCMIQDD
jgi:hypothetical protein